MQPDSVEFLGVDYELAEVSSSKLNLEYLIDEYFWFYGSDVLKYLLFKDILPKEEFEKFKFDEYKSDPSFSITYKAQEGASFSDCSFGDFLGFQFLITNKGDGSYELSINKSNEISSEAIFGIPEDFLGKNKEEFRYNQLKLRFDENLRELMGQKIEESGVLGGLLKLDRDTEEDLLSSISAAEKIQKIFAIYEVTSTLTFKDGVAGIDLEFLLPDEIARRLPVILASLYSADRRKLKMSDILKDFRIFSYEGSSYLITSQDIANFSKILKDKFVEANHLKLNNKFLSFFKHQYLDGRLDVSKDTDFTKEELVLISNYIATNTEFQSLFKAKRLFCLDSDYSKIKSIAAEVLDHGSAIFPGDEGKKEAFRFFIESFQFFGMKDRVFAEFFYRIQNLDSIIPQLIESEIFSPNKRDYSFNDFCTHIKKMKRFSFLKDELLQQFLDNNETSPTWSRDDKIGAKIFDHTDLARIHGREFELQTNDELFGISRPDGEMRLIRSGGKMSLKCRIFNVKNIFFVLDKKLKDGESDGFSLMSMTQISDRIYYKHCLDVVFKDSSTPYIEAVNYYLTRYAFRLDVVSYLRPILTSEECFNFNPAQLCYKTLDEMIKRNPQMIPTLLIHSFFEHDPFSCESQYDGNYTFLIHYYGLKIYEPLDYGLEHINFLNIATRQIKGDKYEDKIRIHISNCYGAVRELITLKDRYEELAKTTEVANLANSLRREILKAVGIENLYQFYLLSCHTQSIGENATKVIEKIDESIRLNGKKLLIPKKKIVETLYIMVNTIDRDIVFRNLMAGINLYYSSEVLFNFIWYNSKLKVEEKGGKIYFDNFGELLLNDSIHKDSILFFGLNNLTANLQIIESSIRKLSRFIFSGYDKAYIKCLDEEVMSITAQGNFVSHVARNFKLEEFVVDDDEKKILFILKSIIGIDPDFFSLAKDEEGKFLINIDGVNLSDKKLADAIVILRGEGIIGREEASSYLVRQDDFLSKFCIMKHKDYYVPFQARFLFDFVGMIESVVPQALQRQVINDWLEFKDIKYANGSNVEVARFVTNTFDAPDSIYKLRNLYKCRVVKKLDGKILLLRDDVDDLDRRKDFKHLVDLFKGFHLSQVKLLESPDGYVITILKPDQIFFVTEKTKLGERSVPMSLLRLYELRMAYYHFRLLLPTEMHITDLMGYTRTEVLDRYFPSMSRSKIEDLFLQLDESDVMRGMDIKADSFSINDLLSKLSVEIELFETKEEVMPMLSELKLGAERLLEVKLRLFPPYSDYETAKIGDKLRCFTIAVEFAFYLNNSDFKTMSFENGSVQIIKTEDLKLLRADISRFQDFFQKYYSKPDETGNYSLAVQELKKEVNESYKKYQDGLEEERRTRDEEARKALARQAAQEQIDLEMQRQRLLVAKKAQDEALKIREDLVSSIREGFCSIKEEWGKIFDKAKSAVIKINLETEHQKLITAIKKQVGDGRLAGFSTSKPGNKFINITKDLLNEDSIRLFLQIVDEVQKQNSKAEEELQRSKQEAEERLRQEAEEKARQEAEARRLKQEAERLAQEAEEIARLEKEEKNIADRLAQLKNEDLIEELRIQKEFALERDGVLQKKLKTSLTAVDASVIASSIERCLVSGLTPQKRIEVINDQISFLIKRLEECGMLYLQGSAIYKTRFKPRDLDFQLTMLDESVAKEVIMDKCQEVYGRSVVGDIQYRKNFFKDWLAKIFFDNKVNRDDLEIFPIYSSNIGYGGRLSREKKLIGFSLKFLNLLDITFATSQYVQEATEKNNDWIMHYDAQIFCFNDNRVCYKPSFRQFLSSEGINIEDAIRNPNLIVVNPQASNSYLRLSYQMSSNLISSQSVFKVACDNLTKELHLLDSTKFSRAMLPSEIEFGSLGIIINNVNKFAKDHELHGEERQRFKFNIYYLICQQRSADDKQNDKFETDIRNLISAGGIDVEIYRKAYDLSRQPNPVVLDPAGSSSGRALGSSSGRASRY